MAKERDALSKTEWGIMNLCWTQGETSAREIYEASLRQKRREYQTVKTMLDRMTAKGYLKRRMFGPIWLYRPAVTRAKALAQAIDGFVDIVLDNTLAPLFTHFVKKETLSPEELEALEALIAKARKEQKR